MDNNLNLNKVASFLIVIVAVILALVYGRNILIPFVFAVLLWFFIRMIKHFLDKIAFVKQKIPNWIKNLFIASIILTLIGIASTALLTSINSLARSYEKYQTNMEIVIEKLNGYFHVDLIALVKEHADSLDFGLIFTSLFSSITYIFSNVLVILIYVLFIFLEETKFPNKLKELFPNKEQHQNFENVIGRIEKSVRNYIGLKTLTSITTGTISYFILYFIGIDSPIFWAFLIFALNFIPTIGSIVGTLFPAVFCLLQFGDFIPSLMVLLFVGSLQMTIGNILEPKFIGDTLNISPIVAILSLLFWGTLWGVTGMIVSVPVTVILVIAFAQFSGTKPIAIILSEKGIIN